ncbi:MAG: BrnT family toxin [Proteobacteria bacterium]|nr:BrnT family toxin [Pseudomonadota bacterium]
MFDWDESKSAGNFERRGFDFEFAAHIFDGDVLERDDTRRDYGERRIIAIGEVEEEILVLVYTWRGDYRRIISARRANERERHVYRQAYPETDA